MDKSILRLLEDSDAPEPAIAPAVVDEATLRLGRLLPQGVYFGTSSWSFPGWRGIVYRHEASEASLARDGLGAYARHPVLRAVGLDRSFYRPLTVAEYARYAAAVPAHFRFLVKAPAALTDAVLRSADGAPSADNPRFLDAAAAAAMFVEPAMNGLGEKAGPLVFQFPPLPRERLRGAAGAALIERIGAFIAALPRAKAGIFPLYAVEVRDPELLTPRLVRMLRGAGARLCLGLHARMPDAQRQSAALRVMDAEGEPDDGPWSLRGPLIVRWSLHGGLRYAQARQRYAPFDRLMDVDVFARGALVHLIRVAQRSGQPAYIIVNNKAEGSAPLTCLELARAVVGD